jgi:hypothetical protein
VSSLSSPSSTVVHKRGEDVFAFPAFANEKNMPTRCIATVIFFSAKGVELQSAMDREIALDGG